MEDDNKEWFMPPPAAQSQLRAVSSLNESSGGSTNSNNFSSVSSMPPPPALFHNRTWNRNAPARENNPPARFHNRTWKRDAPSRKNNPPARFHNRTFKRETPAREDSPPTLPLNNRQLKREAPTREDAAVDGSSVPVVKTENSNKRHCISLDVGTETHVIFCLDYSSSMKRNDVQSSTGRISCWNAVFTCVKEFLKEQLSKNSAENRAVVSVVIFNDEAETLLERLPLIGDGQTVFDALDKAQNERTPKGGTGFSAGLKQCKLLAEHTNSNPEWSSNTFLVFLSDGRPGDLLSGAPPDATVAMQTTFRRNKKKYPAAGVHIEAMQKKHSKDHAQLNLQFVCLCEEGRNWLRYLAQRYNGTFHEPDLAADDEEDDEEDEILEMGVKSRATRLRENYNRALANGNVHSVSDTTQKTSIQATFQSMSSTMTAMRSGGAKLQERQGVVLAAHSQMVSFPATRMILNADTAKISVAPGEKPNGRVVSISKNPFSQGGLRNVYRMRQAHGPRLVAKESRHDIKYQERLKFHIETSQCQARASTFALMFNQALEQHASLRSKGVNSIRFLHAEVYRLKDSNSPGGFRYLAVENEIDGEYKKWNSNNGYVDSSGSIHCQVAQAFSHFSYEKSGQTEMVVDVQGGSRVFTDAQLHTKTKQFGRADRGASGFRDFFKTHNCNFICKKLVLRNHSEGSNVSAIVKQEKK